MSPGNQGETISFFRDPKVVSRTRSSVGIWLTFLAGLAGSYLLWARLGVNYFAISLVILVFGIIFTVISFKYLKVPFFLMVLSVGGFRSVLALQTPLFPDLYLDRILLIWLLMVFMVKFFAEGRLPKKPWRLDLLLLCHGAYILGRVVTGDMVYMNPWVASVFLPYMVFFFAKNIFHNKRDIRALMWVLLMLSVYYNITSVAEKFDINWLLWPRYMVEQHQVFIGRSTGPIRNPGIFGNALGMLLPIHLYFMVTTKRTSLKLLLGLSMALGFAGLYFTYTRGSWMAGLAALVTAAILNRRQYFKTLMPLLFFVPFVAIMFLGIGQDKVMKERVENEGTIGARIGTQITAIRVWKDYPILGCGAFDYARVRADYIDPIEVPILGTIRFENFRNNSAHDMYFGPLAEDGVVGMGLMLSIYGVFIMTMRRKFKWRGSGDHFAMYIIPLFAGFAAAYLLGGLSISYRHTSILGTLFFLAAGITDGYRPETNPDDNPAEKDRVY